MTDPDHKRGNSIWFYQIGLQGRDYVNEKNWTMKTLTSLMDKFGERKAILDYLKFDIETSDFPAMEAMINSGVLSQVKQMGIEIHVPKKDAVTLAGLYKILNGLERAGMLRWYFSMNYYNIKYTRNGFRSCCYEIVYINTNFMPNFRV